MTSSNYYTYAYLREDGTPYYIGKGKGDRAYTKHHKIPVPKDRNKILFLKENLTEEEAFKHEIYMIAILGRKDLETGILRNRTNGGEGSSGRIVTEEHREKAKEIGKILCELNIGVHGRSEKEMSEHGKKVGQLTYEKGVGIHAQTKEEKIELGKKVRDLGLGVHALTKEEKIENGKKGGKTTYEKGVGAFARPKEKISEDSKRGGRTAYEKGVGCFARSKEEMSKDSKKGGKTTGSQKWQCTITGYVSTPGALTRYQKARGIDPSNRIRIK